jgi:hypothetical protein
MASFKWKRVHKRKGVKVEVVKKEIKYKKRKGKKK